MSRTNDFSGMKHFIRYPHLITFLYNAYNNLKYQKYDFPFVICGEPGNGKSMLLLHIYEIWYSLFLDKQIHEEMTDRVLAKKVVWLKKFVELEPLEMNPNDEVADGLSSKEAITRFGRTAEKVYNINRKLNIVSPLTIPDFFDLPPYFRKRVRAIIYVYARGKYKVYTKLGVKYLNSYNANRKVKNMDLARPIFQGNFPDYKGILRERYDDLSKKDAIRTLKEAIEENEDKVTLSETYYDDVVKMFKEGKTYKQTQEELGVGSTVVLKCLNKYKTQLRDKK